MKRYKRVCAEEYSASTLMKEVKKGNRVLLELYYYPFEKTCGVNSFAYDRFGYLHVYAPEHILVTGGPHGCVPLKVSNLKDWRENFLSKEAWMDIQDVDYFACEYEQDLTQFQVLLDKTIEKNVERKTELYLSEDRANFFGPLEADFHEAWLLEHPDYHLGDFTARIGDFEIRNDVTLARYHGTGRSQVVIPDEVKILGSGCFRYNKEIQTVLLPRNLVKIGSDAFRGCDNLRVVIMQDQVEEIEFGAFAQCSSLTKIPMSKSLRRVGMNAFEECDSLACVEFPESLEVIERWAFRDCPKLENLILPKTAKAEIYAFAECKPDIAKLGSMFTVCGNVLYELDETLAQDVVIPKGVRTIKSSVNTNSFRMHRDKPMRSVVFPTGVSKVEDFTTNLEYMIVKPGKRIFNMKRYQYLDKSTLKCFIHCGRDVQFYGYYRDSTQKIVEIAYSTDEILWNGSINGEHFLRLNLDDEEDLQKIQKLMETWECDTVSKYLEKMINGKSRKSKIRDWL